MAWLAMLVPVVVGPAVVEEVDEEVEEEVVVLKKMEAADSTPRILTMGTMQRTRTTCR